MLSGLFGKKPNTGKLTLRTPRVGSVLSNTTQKNTTQKNTTQKNTTQKNKKNIPIPKDYVETSLMENGENFKNLAYGFDGGLTSQVIDNKTGEVLIIPNRQIKEKQHTVIRHLMTTNQRKKFNDKHEKERDEERKKQEYYKTNEYKRKMEELDRYLKEKKQSLLERLNKGEQISQSEIMNIPDLLENLRKNKRYTQQNRFPQWPLWYKIQGGKQKTRKNKQRKHKKGTRKH